MKLTDIPSDVFTHIFKFCTRHDIVSYIYYVSKIFKQYVSYYCKMVINKKLNNDDGYLRHIFIKNEGNINTYISTKTCEECIKTRGTVFYKNYCVNCVNNHVYCKSHCKIRPDIEISISSILSRNECGRSHSLHNKLNNINNYKICDRCYNKIYHALYNKKWKSSTRKIGYKCGCWFKVEKCIK